MIKHLLNSRYIKAALLVLLTIASGTFSINAVASDKAGAKKGKLKFSMHTHCHRDMHKHGWTKKTRKTHNHRHCHKHIHIFRNPRHGYKFGKTKIHKALIHKNHHAKQNKTGTAKKTNKVKKTTKVKKSNKA
ncbi:hypothetical protein MNBD_GAMMA12-512 [hydrothermal vent metagenome]|uniref:Uncharacterized protein n=1 Tax=hydrothermal vent metagenome TaxID=652676 RepID=A0A3B0Y008_9ZZZZ